MENLLVVLLLFLLRDPAFKEQLSSFLAFYRENRDLIASLTKNEAPMSEVGPQKQENRPADGVGSLSVLEEALRRVMQTN